MQAMKNGWIRLEKKEDKNKEKDAAKKSAKREVEGTIFRAVRLGSSLFFYFLGPFLTRDQGGED
jgi:hypothetical protein